VAAKQKKEQREGEGEKQSRTATKNCATDDLPTTTTTKIPHLLLLLLLPPPSFAMRLAPPFGTALLLFPPEKKLRALIRISSPSSQQLESFCYVTCKASSFKFSISIISPCRGGASRIKLKTFLPKRTHAHTHKLITNQRKQTNNQLALKNTHPTQ
jgi:hypothetical protein